MNWETYISKFQKIDISQVPSFTRDREMDQAIHLYNKSVDHISRDSADIALISLRRLAADYPGFGLAGLLAAGLLAMDENYDEATELLEQAVNEGQLDEAWQEHAQQCRQLIQQDMHLAARQDDEEVAKPSRVRPIINTAAVLEKIKRQNKVKMASEKERQDVMRKGEQTEGETFVETARQPVDYLRLALPVAGALLVLLLIIFASTRVYSAFSERSQQNRQIDWLMTRLESLAEENESVDRLLDEFEMYFLDSGADTTTGDNTQGSSTTDEDDADTTETSDTDDVPTPSPIPEPTATPEPTPIPVPTTDPDILLMEDSYNAIQEAVSLRNSDVMAAADLLFSARDLLETVPDSKIYEAEGVTASELSDEIESRLSEMSSDAANDFRRAGRALFDDEQYEEALVHYLKAFELDPRNYGGGTAYYTGRCYQMMGQYEEARPYFQYVVEQFEGRDIAGYSANRLREMGF